MTIQEITVCKEDQTFDYKSIQIEPKALAATQYRLIYNLKVIK